MPLSREESLYVIGCVGNNIKVEIREGKKQLINYWVAEVKYDVFGDYDIKSFVKAKEIGKVKSFLNIADGSYVLQFGKSSSKDTSRRQIFTVENGVIA